MNTETFEVVILNDYASLTGGSTAVAIASALELAARGVRVTLFTCVGPIAPQLCDVPNLEVICLDQPEIAKDRNRIGAFISGWRNARAVRALRRLLAGKSPRRTIVHAHTWMKALSPFALAEIAPLKFPLIVTLHDFFITCPNGGFFVHRTQEICRRDPLSLSCWSCHCDRRNFAHKLWRNARTVLQNTVLQVPDHVSAFVAVSAFSLKIMEPHLPAGIPAWVVRNPVECAPTPPARVTDNRDFLFIGRFEPEKGVELFAQAVRRSGVAATFVGDGALMPRVRELCPGAQFTGWLGTEEIRERLRTARALVFPPLWYETLGLVVIEAAAAGVPAIVADGCAATEFIRNDANGLHFKHGSVAALSEQMRILARNDGLAAYFGRAAYDWYWRDPWTAARHIDQLLEIYARFVDAPVPEAARRVA